MNLENQIHQKTVSYICVKNVIMNGRKNIDKTIPKNI